jgi:hypothetical protein
VQVVVEADRYVAADRGALKFFMPGARAVHHHPRIRADAVDDAVVGEFPGLVQHAGVCRLAGIDLLHIARGGEVDQMRGVRPGDVDLLQSGNIHQPGPGADREILFVGVLVVAPGGAHAAPILKPGPQPAMAVGQCRKSPGSGHLLALPIFRSRFGIPPPRWRPVFPSRILTQIRESAQY